MRRNTLHLPGLVLGAFLAGISPAQVPNDECGTATPVSSGTNGPFLNTGATSSATPGPFTCDPFGGYDDTWYVFAAPADGYLTVDNCSPAAPQDIELYDGNAGCAGLSSLACSTSMSCDSLTAQVQGGDLVYIRVGDTFFTGGNWFHLNLTFQTGNPATAIGYGEGWRQPLGSFYESFPQASAFDLSNTAITMIPAASGGYSVVPGSTTFVAPSAAAIALPANDEGNSIVPVSVPFPYDGGTTSTFDVGTNGMVSVATQSTHGWALNVGNFLGASQTGWWVWHNFNAAVPGSGVIRYEEVAGVLCITWDAVYNWLGTSAADANTFQFQFDTNTGMVHLVFQTMSGLGNGYLVGYSPGGASLDPGSRDISGDLAAGFPVLPAAGTESVTRITLSASGTPVLGSSITLDTSNLPANTFFCITEYGYQQFDPGIDLGFLQMPECRLYNSLDVIHAVTPTAGSSSSLPITVPVNPALSGGRAFVQSWTVTAGSNPQNMLTSNGLELRLGDF